MHIKWKTSKPTYINQSNEIMQIIKCMNQYIILLRAHIAHEWLKHNLKLRKLNQTVLDIGSSELRSP